MNNKLSLSLFTFAAEMSHSMSSHSAQHKSLTGEVSVIFHVLMASLLQEFNSFQMTLKHLTARGEGVGNGGGLEPLTYKLLEISEKSNAFVK
jgi:hypothetical protein